MKVSDLKDDHFYFVLKENSDDGRLPWSKGSDLKSHGRSHRLHRMRDDNEQIPEGYYPIRVDLDTIITVRPFNTAEKEEFRLTCCRPNWELAHIRHAIDPVYEAIPIPGRGPKKSKKTSLPHVVSIMDDDNAEDAEIVALLRRGAAKFARMIDD